MCWEITPTKERQCPFTDINIATVMHEYLGFLRALVTQQPFTSVYYQITYIKTGLKTSQLLAGVICGRMGWIGKKLRPLASSEGFFTSISHTDVWKVEIHVNGMFWCLFVEERTVTSPHPCDIIILRHSPISIVYLTSRDFNRRQLGENTADRSSSGLNSFRTVKNQTMVLFWLLIGMKFRVD